MLKFNLLMFFLNFYKMELFVLQPTGIEDSTLYMYSPSSEDASIILKAAKLGGNPIF